MRRDKARAYGPYRHGKHWRVHFVTTGPGGDRTTTYEVFASRADAQKCVDGANDEAQGITVKAAITAFIDVKRAQGRADLTIVAYEGRLILLLAEYLSRPVRSVQHRGAELYAAVLAGRSADGHQNLLVAGRLWGKWCTKQHWLKSDPFADVEPVGQRIHGADKVHLTIDQSRRLEEWCLDRPTDPAAVLTLGYLYLGTRNTELARRSVADLDDGGRILRIGKTKTKSGRRTLRVPEPLDQFLLALTEGKPDDAPIFVDHNGKRMSRSVALKRVLDVCKAAGVPIVPPQALRRTHASLATDAGETSLAVARCLGQSVGDAPKVTTQSYIGRDAAAAAKAERALRTIRGRAPGIGN